MLTFAPSLKFHCKMKLFEFTQRFPDEACPMLPAAPSISRKASPSRSLSDSSSIGAKTISIQK